MSRPASQGPGSINRRTLLLASAGALAIAGAGVTGFIARRELKGTLLSAFEDARGDQYVGGVRLESSQIFGGRVPMRAHGCAVHPDDPMRVLYFARRPGTKAFELDRATNAVREILVTPKDRHLAGHGVFSRDAQWLFTPEHDFVQPRGVLAVRDARTYRIVGEYDTGGIDPHEVLLSRDGSKLIVANGGILTHPRSYREKLNIPTMDPSLVILDARTGERLEQRRLPDHLLSIRHLALTSDGDVAVGLQYEGAPERAPSVAALYRPGEGLHLLDVPIETRPRLRGYVASIALSEAANVVVAACPYGQGVACWDLRTRTFIDFIPAAETYGVSRLADGSLMASQRDGTMYSLHDAHSRSRFVTVDRESPIRWDDHWTSVIDS